MIWTDSRKGFHAQILLLIIAHLPPIKVIGLTRNPRVSPGMSRNYCISSRRQGAESMAVVGIIGNNLDPHHHDALRLGLALQFQCQCPFVDICIGKGAWTRNALRLQRSKKSRPCSVLGL